MDSKRKLTPMDMIGKTFRNTSGKRIQVPNRLSDEFCWAPMEEIVIMEKRTIPNKNPEFSEKGYIVHNIDYYGNERCFETSWITEKILLENFTEIT
jgi:hypothetical protein